MDLKDGALNRCVCKNFENITYHKIKIDDNNIIKTIESINICTKTNINQILSFEQGDVSVRLHFRKIGDGLWKILFKSGRKFPFKDIKEVVV